MMNDYLRKKFLKALDVAEVDSDEVSEEFSAVTRGYSEHHRYYHNLDHVNRLLSLCEELDINDPDIILAVFYHDSIYRAGDSSSEERSAAFAREALIRLGVALHRVNRVCDMILSTADHLNPPNDSLTRLFLDLDMSILGSSREEYEAYVKGVRKEYHWFTAVLFRKNRREFLKKLLDAESIFSTELFRDKYEATARANIKWELGL